MPIRAALLLLSLVAVSCGRDAPDPSAKSSSTAAGPEAGCPGLGAHWREVWTAEVPKGLDRRRHVLVQVGAMWTNACTSVAKEPPQDLKPVLDELRDIRTFAGIEGLSTSGGTATRQKLVQSLKEAVTRTKNAYAVDSTSIDECEEAITNAAFCGDDVDKASAKSAASSKNDGACAALSVLLTKKCQQQ